MKIIDVNPHIRFAGEITYSSKNRTVYVKDCRLFYIISGNGRILIHNNEITLKKNTLFYCCGGMEYTINTEEYIHLYSLNFDLSQAQKQFIMPFIPENSQKTNHPSPINYCDIKDSHFLNSFLVLEKGTEFKNSISNIVKEYSDQKIYFKETCSTALKKMIIDLHKTSSEIKNDSSIVMKKILDYINLNFTEEVKNNELAEIAGYHEYYLNRLFIKHTGMSMHKYILNLRIYESKRLLLNSNIPISEIATQSGFNSISHFSAYFKKETGISPSDYRYNFKNNI